MSKLIGKNLEGKRNELLSKRMKEKALVHCTNS